MADGSSTSANKETVTLRLKSGEQVDVVVPGGLSDEDVKSYARMKRPDLFGAPAGIQKPNPPMEYSNETALREEGMSTDPKMGEMMNPEVLNPTGAAVAGGIAAAGPGLMAARAAGPKLAQLVRAYPKISTMAGIEASHYLPGMLGRMARQVPTWAGMAASSSPEAGAEAETARPRLRDLISGETPEEVPDAPSGRFVLSPDEAAAQDQQMRLAQQMARQRGMQYAAGMKPNQ